MITLKRQFPLVRLHVVMHSVLARLCRAALTTYVVPVIILLIRIRHCLNYQFGARAGSIFYSPSKNVPTSLFKGMITIVTLVIGHDFKKGLQDCLESKRAYASRHGYDYREGGTEFWDRTRPVPWSKIPYLLSILNGLPEGAIIWLSDADVLITNPELTLEAHILPFFPETKDMMMTIDACGHLNSGNMFMRNTGWLRDFWARVGQQKDLLYHIWWENAAIIKLLETNPSDLAHVEITSDHTRSNSYLQGIPGQPLWTPGDFLVHFAGIYDVARISTLVKAIQAGKIPRLSIHDSKGIDFVDH